MYALYLESKGTDKVDVNLNQKKIKHIKYAHAPS